MTSSEPVMNLDPEVQQLVAEDEKQERKRRGLLLILLLLLLVLCCVIALFIRYLLRPAPLPEVLPGIISEKIAYPPTYKFSIIGVDNPVGVAVSPDGQRIYVAESSETRMIKMFDRDGQLIHSFAPPGTSSSNRKPTYIAVDSSGRVFVSDHYNHVIDIFDADGNFIDSIIRKELTLSKFVAAHNNGSFPAGTLAYYNNIDKLVYYQLPDQHIQTAPIETGDQWAPLGLRFDGEGNLLVTDLTAGKHSVIVFPASALTGNWIEFNPQIVEFGVEGEEDGQFSFPNSVVSDSRGNFYVSDGNNGRISFWTADHQYKSFFGFGSTENSLNLPRGLWIDSKDHLHVADAVGQFIRVFDVSGEQPAFLYSFGNFGLEDGLFNYPTDIYIDNSGRVYVADRENDRIQIWSY